MFYDIKADLHTHTVHSLHAYSTVKENSDQAKKQGLKYLATTDHMYDIYDNRNHAGIFLSFKDLVKEKNMDLISGIELNIGQTLKMQSEINRRVPFKIASLHDWFYDMKKDGETILADIIKYHKEVGFNVLGHIDRYHDFSFAFYDMLTDYAAESGMVIELNESNINDTNAEKLLIWLRLAMAKKCNISLGSDAHYYTAVGDFTKAKGILNSINFPDWKVVNCNETWLMQFCQ